MNRIIVYYYNADQNVLLATTLPLVLLCVVLSTALIMVTVVILCYSRANKRGNPAVKSRTWCDNRPKATNEFEDTTVGSKHGDKPEIEEAYYATVKSICDDGSKEIKGQEVYYSTIDICTCAVDPLTFDVEKNCAYGNVRMHRMVN